ncbi:DNA polymerase III subunit delta [Candidatus Peregrinibacteria bacterium CG10_big_fil_rev_8_21_14_0_10_42_8]|nr:MAG: DNA polymerase III subunit delta [Candidatus Peregrinibacteria bacterium CG10_big_fil_rev_8_21_14_0_10_42_8]
MSQIFLLTGENLYQIAEEQKRWINNFTEKFGDENIMKLQAKGLKVSALLDALATSPFIAEKRLVVLDGIPKMEKEHMKQIDNVIHPAVILLIVESKPDKRLSATKEILVKAEVKTFPVIHGAKLASWVEETAAYFGARIRRSEIQFLIDHVGEDQMLLFSEIQKIATYAYGREISRDDINLLVMLSAEQAGWKLMDLMAAGNSHGALTFARELMNRGESPYGLWSRMTWIIAQLVLVTACVQDGDSHPASIAKTAGVPFPTARTLVPLAKKMDSARLASIVDRFTDADIALKTGGYRSTVDATDEITALIDSCIMCTC